VYRAGFASEGEREQEERIPLCLFCWGPRYAARRRGRGSVTRSPSKCRRKLTQAELRALATPGLLARWIDADGRSNLEQLAPESGARRKDFAHGLTAADEITNMSERRNEG
jgi:hypothetical protein